MARLDKERQAELEPQRMAFAKQKLTLLGYTITYEDKSRLEFEHKGKVVKFFPYSGWATGKSIKDGRGLNNLIRQLVFKNEN